GRGIGGRPAGGSAGRDGTDQGVQDGEGGVDLSGALLEPGQDVAAGVDRDGEQVTQVHAVVGEGAGGVVPASVDVQTAGPGDVAEGTEIAGLRGGEHGGAGEAFGHQAVAQGEVDDLADVRTDGGQSLGRRDIPQGGAAGQDPAAKQPVPGDFLVQAQQGFLDAQRVGVEDAVADVVAQGADVTDVVVEAFQFQQDCAHPVGFDGYL